MRNLDKTAFENAEISGREKALKALNKVNLLDDFWETDYKIVPTEGYCKWDFEIREKKPMVHSMAMPRVQMFPFLKMKQRL